VPREDQGLRRCPGGHHRDLIDSQGNQAIKELANFSIQNTCARHGGLRRRRQNKDHPSLQLEKVSG